MADPKFEAPFAKVPPNGSPANCAILSIVSGAITGLAGPGQRTAIIVPCTVIRSGDMADQLLDRQRLGLAALLILDDQLTHCG